MVIEGCQESGFGQEEIGGIFRDAPPHLARSVLSIPAEPAAALQLTSADVAT